jgi:hypothetical protein
MMMRQFVQITLLTGTLIVGLVPLAMAVTRGVVATVTAVDDKTSMVTLKTDVGQVFQLTKDDLPYWQVGSKVECDQTDDNPNPRLQNCQPWQ